MSRCEILEGDCRELLAAMEPDSVDAIVTDPPYGLEFMGKEWDKLDHGLPQENVWKGRHGKGGSKEGGSERWGEDGRSIPSGRTTFGGKRDGFRRCTKCGKRQFSGSPCKCAVPEWVLEYPAGPPSGMVRMQRWHEAWAREAYRVLKPGGHLLAFGGSRTYHRMACAVEDAGFEIRDQIQYLYGSGFPKSMNLDRMRGDAFCGCSTSDDPVRGMREAQNDAVGMEEAGESPDLFSTMQRRSPGAGVGTTRPQGTGGLDGSWPTGLPGENVGREESRMEGRGDLLQEEGELQEHPLCPSPGVGPPHGPEGRVHHGAPAGHGGNGGAAPGTGGGRPSQGPRPDEQRAGEPRTVAVEPRPQARGAWPICGRCGLSVVPRGLGTALKPAHEPIVVARKPLVGTVAANVEAHGTGALNVDGCRIGIGTDDRAAMQGRSGARTAGQVFPAKGDGRSWEPGVGRWPANVVLDEAAGAMLDEQSGRSDSGVAVRHRSGGNTFGGENAKPPMPDMTYGDSGGASRFFKTVEWSPDELRFRYCPKADRSERGAEGVVSNHPTHKPVDLMRWLVRLVTPPGGLVVDPFAGSGTTGVACSMEGFDFVGMELDPEYVRIARARIGAAPLSLFGALSRETP